MTLSGGNGGSGGGNGVGYTMPSAQFTNDNTRGGTYGGGGGANPGTALYQSGTGQGGAVRIIWPGEYRQFPSTRTTDE